MKKGTDENIKGLSDPNISLNIFEIFRLSAKYARWKQNIMYNIQTDLEQNVTRRKTSSWHQSTAASWQLASTNSCKLAADILPSVRSSIHPYIQIIMVVNLQCGMELNEFRPPEQQWRPSPSLLSVSSSMFSQLEPIFF